MAKIIVNLFTFGDWRGLKVPGFEFRFLLFCFTAFSRMHESEQIAVCACVRVYPCMQTSIGAYTDMPQSVCIVVCACINACA